MSNEIKAALHVAMEAIDAKLHRTDLKPGHENDLRAAKGVLRSMISNLPAASGQQEDLHDAIMRLPCNVPSEVLEKHSYKVGHRDARHAAAELAAAHAAHPAPAQQESEKPYGWVNAGTERQQTTYATLNVGPENPWVETANAFPVYTRAPAPAALTDEQIAAAVRPLYRTDEAAKMGLHDDIETARAILATASAAPAEQARDAERLDFVLNNDAFIYQQGREEIATYQLWTQDEDENYVVLSGDHKFHPTKRAAVDAAIASQQKGSQV